MILSSTNAPALEHYCCVFVCVVWCVVHRHLEQEVGKETSLTGEEPKEAEDLKEIIQFYGFPF